MTNRTHPRADLVQRTLESNDVLSDVDDVQHAVRLRATHQHLRATVLVFHTGTILVQGRFSALEQWLCMVKASIESGRAIPAFVPPDFDRDEQHTEDCWPTIRS